MIMESKFIVLLQLFSQMVGCRKLTLRSLLQSVAQNVTSVNNGNVTKGSVKFVTAHPSYRQGSSACPEDVATNSNGVVPLIYRSEVMSSEGVLLKTEITFFTDSSNRLNRYDAEKLRSERQKEAKIGQTRAHTLLVFTLWVKQIVIGENKTDSIEPLCSEPRLDEIAGGTFAYQRKDGCAPDAAPFVPVGTGTTWCPNVSWYKGRSIMRTPKTGIDAKIVYTLNLYGCRSVSNHYETPCTLTPTLYFYFDQSICHYQL